MCFAKLGNSDSNDMRTLTVPAAIDPYSNTIENCIDVDAVDGYHVAGVEFARDSRMLYVFPLVSLMTLPDQTSLLEV